MKNKILDNYYKGNAINAYEFFGAHISEERGKKGVRFTTFAPHAQEIQVIGSFDDWSCKGHKMRRSDDKGVWTLFIAGAKEGDMYKYRITQATGRVVDKMDPYAFYSELRPNTASIVTNLEYKKWSDGKWLAERDKNFAKPMNIYELHIGSWKKEEDVEWVNYRSIAKELIAYVKENHFTHIELMPLNEYPFDGSWGYQCSGYFSATSRYGTCEDLMYLINACHKAKIGVIMDFVPVHFVRDDFSLSYFDGTPLYEYEKACDADSQWGTANFNLWKEEVRSFLMSAAAFWIDKYHVDGLRMDAISNVIHWHGNKDLGTNEGALHFIKRMNFNLHEAFPGIMLIAEDSSDFPKVTHPTVEGGLGFDYKWDMGWMNDTLDYFRTGPEYRSSNYHKLTFSMMYYYDARFLLPLSHDEVVHGKATILQKMNGDYDNKFPQARALYMYMYAHPGKKLNFMGNEFGQLREWDEKREQDWMLLDYPIHSGFARFMKDLNEIYLTHSALWEKDYQADGFRWIDCHQEQICVYVLERSSKKEHLTAVFNFSDRSQTYELKLPGCQKIKELLNSDLEAYGGSLKRRRPARKITDGRYQAELPAFSAMYYIAE